MANTISPSSYIDDLLILDRPHDAYRQLEDDAGRLFVEERLLRVLVWPNDSGNQLSPITDALPLTDHIKRCLSEYRTSFIILQQEHTWGPILISLDSFKAILVAFQVFTPFIEFVNAFGLKISESDENFSAHHRRKSPIRSGECQGTQSVLFSISNLCLQELCYNLRYPVKNGRIDHPIWSIRHVAAYQQYYHKSGISRWLLVQPSQDMKQKVEDIIQADGCLTHNPVIPHLAILLSSEKGWRGYINDLQEEFNELDYKAKFFKLAISDNDSFYVRFGDAQLLHRRRQKLLKSFAILDSCISIAQGCKRFCGDIDKLSQVQTPLSVNVEIGIYITKVGAHKRAVNLLLKQSAGTLKLLFQVLQFRNDEALAQSNTIMQHNSRVLSELGSSSREENKAMIVLTKQGRQDSRFMKILTFIAMLYLPASLVASIFNSSLIASVSDGEVPMQTHFKSATQFWIYPVSTILLMCITTVPVLYLESLKRKKGTRKHDDA